MSDYLLQAIDLYQDTIRRFPHNVVARNGLAEALKQGERYEEALQMQEETIRLFPHDAVALISRADTLSRMGRIEESIDAYHYVIRLFPENVVARTGLAETLRRAATRQSSKTATPESDNAAAPYKYQVALSFAGEDRSIAKDLAERLKERGVSVFFDEYEQASLWGKDLYQHLQHVYRDSAQFCVVLLSTHYAAKLWPRHELKQAQARAFEENREYILPLRIDDTEISGISKTIGYLDIRNTPVAVVVQHILDKLAAQI